MTACKYVFCFFLLTSFFQSHLNACDKSLEPFDELAQDIKDMQVANVFCPEGWSREKCADENSRALLLEELIDKNPSDFVRRAKEAAVTVSVLYSNDKESACSATVVKLKRNGIACPKNILLSAGHCFSDLKGHTIDIISVYRNRNDLTQLDADKIASLTTDCEASKTANKKDDCFLSGRIKDRLLAPDMDRALIPISYSLPPNIKPLEIEIDNILTSSEMDSCIKGTEKKKINMVSLFMKPHYEFFKTQYPSNGFKRALALKCPAKKEDISLKDPSDLNSITNSKMLLNKCPTRSGNSGSLVNFSCGRGEKKGIFVQATGDFRNPRSIRTIWQANIERLYYGKIYIYDPTVHHEVRDLKNSASPITKNILNRAFDRFCKTGIAQAH